MNSEPPSTTRHWISERALRTEVYSDISLRIAEKYVGTFDLSQHLLEMKGVHLGARFDVSLPGVLIVGGDGRIIWKKVSKAPG